MKYILICRDGKDSNAASRRLTVRERHLSDIQQNPHFVFGTAILENGNMVGSVIVMDYENEKELEEYLENEVYVTGNVWQEIEKIPCADGFFGAHFKK